MPVYTFQLAAQLAGRAVSVVAAGGTDVVTSGVLDGDAKFVATLPVGDYIATAGTGYYKHSSAGTVDLGDRDGLLTEAVANSTFVPQYRDGKVYADSTASRGYLPNIVSLITGQTDETLTGTSGVTVTADTTNYKVGGRGWQISASAAGGPGVQIDFPGGLDVPAAQALTLWVYVPDATKVTSFGMYVYTDATYTAGNRWGRFTNTMSPQQTVVIGWNRLRVPILDGGTMPMKKIYRVLVALNCNAATSITVGHLYLECPEKARILFVSDGGYKSFLANAYPDLKRRGWPCTFAPALKRLPSDAGLWSEKPTVAELSAYGHENRNSMSFHSWDSEVTATMTADQYRAETTKALKFCQQQGWRGRMWRAAITQNAAQNWPATRDLLIGSTSGQNVSRDNIWPPNDLMQLYRTPLDTTATNASIDGWFTKMQDRHVTYIIYVHGVGTWNNNDGNEFNTPKATWDYFIAKADAAVAAGWLEFVTFEQLYYGSGGTFTEMGGEAVARYLDSTGTEVVKRVL